MNVFWILLSVSLGATDRRTTEQCFASSEAAQRDKRAGDFLQARAAFARCRTSGCPSVVRADCERWFEEVNAAISSVIVVPREGERDLISSDVVLDDLRIEAERFGRPLEVNPGRHRVRVTLPDGRSQDVDFVAAAGEKNRRLMVEFEPVPQKPAVPTVVPPAPVADDGRNEQSKSDGTQWYVGPRVDVRVASFSILPSPLVGVEGGWGPAFAHLALFFRGRGEQLQAGGLLRVGVSFLLVNWLDLVACGEGQLVGVGPGVAPGLGASMGLGVRFPLGIRAEVGGGLSWLPGGFSITPLSPFLGLSLSWRYAKTVMRD